MAIKGIKTSVTGLALTLAVAGIGGHAFAQDFRGYDRGYDHGHDVNRAYDDGRGGYNNAGANAQQRFGQIRWSAIQMAQSGRISRWQSDRAMSMLRDISRQFDFARRDGRVTQGEAYELNARLDGVQTFLQNARNDGGRHWDRRG